MINLHRLDVIRIFALSALLLTPCAYRLCHPNVVPM